MKWIDVSQLMHNNMPVWPGDTPFAYTLVEKKEQNKVVNVGKISCSTHAGTHVDAPYHYDEKGDKIHELDVSLYIGPAQVILCKNQEQVRLSHLKELQKTERLLIRTDSALDLSHFPDTYTYLHPEVGPYLAKKGVKLIGVDVPSVDYVDSKTLDAHHALHEHGIHILENVVLRDIKPGVYYLIALPLPIKGADGCPVRAVLREMKYDATDPVLP